MTIALRMSHNPHGFDAFGVSAAFRDGPLIPTGYVSLSLASAVSEAERIMKGAEPVRLAFDATRGELRNETGWTTVTGRGEAGHLPMWRKGARTVAVVPVWVER